MLLMGFLKLFKIEEIIFNDYLHGRSLFQIE